MKYIVTSNAPIWIKNTPSLSGKNIGLVQKDDIIEALGETNGYIRIKDGYILKNLESISLVDMLTVSVTDKPKKSTLSATVPLITDADKNVNALADTDDDYWTYESDFNFDPTKYVPKNDDVTPDPTNQAGDAKKKMEEEKAKQQLDPRSRSLVVMHLDQLAGGNEGTEKMMFSSLKGIYGLPYQWMPHVDPRISATTRSANGATSSNADAALYNFYPGRIYTERIITKSPIFLIAPGRPSYNANNTKTIAEIIEEEVKGLEEETKNDLNQSSGVFYTFKYDTVEYFQYVNPILRIAAQNLNIADLKLNGTELRNFDWSKNYSKAIHGEAVYTDNSTNIGGIDMDILKPKLETNNISYTGSRSIAFYLDSEFSISDSFSNTTTESSLKSSANFASDKIRELQFMIGWVASAAGKDSEAVKQAQTQISELTKSGYAKGNGSITNLFNSILGTANTLIEGGRMMFPNIWQDSSFGRAYDFKIKLVSPDYDTYSWYMNIMVPLVHLLCLTMPQKASTSFAYIRPFLVRAFYKGLFNCDLGLITNLSISRGQEAGWTQSGLPTVVEVSMTIQDLYDGIAMSKGSVAGFSGAFGLLKNPIYLDYVANLCGLNINEPNLERIIGYYTILARGAIADLPSVVHGNLSQWLDNVVTQIYKKAQSAGLSG